MTTKSTLWEQEFNPNSTVIKTYASVIELGSEKDAYCCQIEIHFSDRIRIEKIGDLFNNSAKANNQALELLDEASHILFKGATTQ
jgi:hypothetical protein